MYLARLTMVSLLSIMSMAVAIFYKLRGGGSLIQHNFIVNKKYNRIAHFFKSLLGFKKV